MSLIETENRRFEIRKAVASSDMEQIMAVEKDAFREEIQEEREVFEKRLSVFPDGFFIIEEICTHTDGDRKENRVTAGYFCSEIWESVPIQNECFTLGHDIDEFHREKGTVFYISSLALRKEYKGLGLGDRLFNDCMGTVLKEHAGLKEAVLLVNSSWNGARHIYSKAGFAEYGRIGGFFPDGDGILMKRSLR